MQSVAGTELSENATNTSLYITCNAIKPRCPGGLSSPQKTHTNSTQKTPQTTNPLQSCVFSSTAQFGHSHRTQRQHLLYSHISGLLISTII